MITSTPSLYERLGGTYGIAGAVDILVDRLFANVVVNANDAVRAHHGQPANAPGYKFLVTAWSIEAAGGPSCYPGLDMVAAHDQLAITQEGVDAVAIEIASTLSFLGVPAAEHRDPVRPGLRRSRDVGAGNGDGEVAVAVTVEVAGRERAAEQHPLQRSSGSGDEEAAAPVQP